MVVALAAVIARAVPAAIPIAMIMVVAMILTMMIVTVVVMILMMVMGADSIPLLNRREQQVAAKNPSIMSVVLAGIFPRETCILLRDVFNHSTLNSHPKSGMDTDAH